MSASNEINFLILRKRPLFVSIELHGCKDTSFQFDKILCTLIEGQNNKNNITTFQRLPSLVYYICVRNQRSKFNNPGKQPVERNSFGISPSKDK